GEHAAAGPPELRLTDVAAEPPRARLQAQLPFPVDVAEGERRGRLRLQRAQLDAKAATPGREALAFVRSDPREQGDARPEPGGRGSGVERGPAETPIRLARKLVARHVTDREQVGH